MHDTETTTPLPTLDQADKDLLLLYLSLDENPIATAQESGSHYIDVLAWSSRPQIAAYIEHHRTIRAQRQRDAALAHLEHIMRSTQDETVCCRASIAILRATDPARFKSPRQSRPSRTAAAAGASPPADARDPRPAHPAQPPGPLLPPPGTPAPRAAANHATHDTTAIASNTPTHLAGPIPSPQTTPAHILAAELLAQIAREDELADQLEDQELDEEFDDEELHDEELDDEPGDDLDQDLDDLQNNLDEDLEKHPDLDHHLAQNLHDLGTQRDADPHTAAGPPSHGPTAPPSAPAQPDDPAAPEHIPRHL
jgi:hypothetical protein